MKVLFVSSSSISDSNASSNRTRSLIKGLKEKGCEIKVLELHSANTNKREKYIYDNVEIIYARSGTNFKSKFSFLLREIRAQFITLTTLFKYRDHKNIVTNTHDILLLPILIICASCLRMKIFGEYSEYPYFLRNKEALTKVKIISRISFFLQIKFFYAFFLMTTPLIKFYTKYTNKKLILLPMSVDLDRFTSYHPTITSNYYIFCGNLSIKQNGTLNMIKSFNAFSQKYPDLFLYIVGSTCNTDDMELIREASNTNDRIKLLGQIAREEIPRILCSARGLLLCRPNNKQAEGGFPTKLGEYLATGKPVVVTRTGTICEYLKDQFSAFISETDSPEDFARELEKVESDYESALIIGSEGKKVAQEVFDLKRQAEIIMREISN